MVKSKLSALPYIIWAVLFTVVPLGLIVYFAFTTAEGEFTLHNISQVSIYAPVLFRSIWLAFIATVICLVVAYPLAYILSRMHFRQQKVMLMLVMLPMWMNFLLRTYAWMTMLEKNGLINRLLGLIGLGPLNMINTPGAVVLGMVYNYLPFMILPLYSIMTKIDGSVIEAAQDLGGNFWGVFSKVVLPLSMPGITTGITMVFVPALTTFVISNLLGGGMVLLIGNVIEQEFTFTSDWNLGSGLSLVLMVFILISMALLAKYDKDGEGAAF